MIKDIGCGEDGSVFMSLIIETVCDKCGKKETQLGVIPMDDKTTSLVINSLTKAQQEAREWKLTGKPPKDYNPEGAVELKVKGTHG